MKIIVLFVTLVFGILSSVVIAEEPLDEKTVQAIRALEKETGVPSANLIPRMKEILNDYNSMASANFSVALKLFREDYVAKKIRIFGEVDERSTFNIDDYQFVVIPTIAEKNPDKFNPEHCNMASHANGMVVMLACKWSVEGDKRGGVLLEKLKKLIPKYKLSDPKHGNLLIIDLKKDSDMMKSEAAQWSWRMNDLPQK